MKRVPTAGSVTAILGLGFMAVVLVAQEAPLPSQNEQSVAQSVTTPLTNIPLSLEQMPSGPTVVAFQDGQLTVDAHNAMLADVLQAVCFKLGIILKMPRGVNDRVVASLGPAPPRIVFASLLNGSKFNYVLVESSDAQGQSARLVLTPQGKLPDAKGRVHGVDPRRASRTGFQSSPLFATRPLASEPTIRTVPAVVRKNSVRP
jgi:hypothetical protein